MYARLQGLRRVMVPVPLLTPRLSSRWLALVSPVHVQVGRERIDGVRPRCGCRAGLQFEVTAEAGGSRVRQTALFDPVGIGGLLYWQALWGIHQLVFAGMLRNIVRAARIESGSKPRSGGGAGLRSAQPQQQLFDLLP